MRNHFGQGRIEGEYFVITYAYAEDAFLIASMKREGHLLERLVAACSHVVEYEPFCKYMDLGGMKTYEWDKNNPDERFKELDTKGKRIL